MSDIRTRPATQDYRDGFDRVFGKKAEVTEEIRYFRGGSRLSKTQICRGCEATGPCYDGNPCDCACHGVFNDPQ